MRMAIVLLLAFYQRAISPYLRPRCRFYPSCSSYAIDAIRTSGVLRGVYYSIKRVIRCHPFATGGFDPYMSEKKDL